jgi:hypothetical protein
MSVEQFSLHHKHNFVQIVLMIRLHVQCVCSPSASWFSLVTGSALCLTPVYAGIANQA